MTSRDRKATEKGREYQLELKCKAVGEAWKSLKSVSEDLRSFMAEKRSVEEAKVLYARWMELYESFMQADDAYSSLLSEDGRRQYCDTWFHDKDIWISNIKSRAEEWFLGNVDEQSGSSQRSRSSSKKSSARLAAEARRMEELKKMEMFLEEKQELERKVKLMEMKLQQEKERSRIREEIVRSQSRSQMILEMEHEDADSQDLGEDVVYNGMLDKQGRDSEDEGLHNIDGESLGGKRSTLRSLDKVLLELEKPH
eukprot:gene20969-23025_t